MPKRRPKAYSYLRFSTPDQLRGDSLRRQTEAARHYAHTHNLDLDDLTFRDLGVSAFRGKNATEGALGAFLEAVDSGVVKSGSYLLVENLDRLSRDRIMPALNRFSALLERRIIVVTLSDGKIYTADSLNEIQDLMLSLFIMSRAHEESRMKSQRLRAAWENKRERAASGEHILTGRAPAWLRVRDGKFEVVKRRAKIVREIFDLALAGYGKAAIATRLNIGGVPPFGKADGWHPSYIQKILANEAVIGRFQPHRNSYAEGRKKRIPDGDPVEGYFPAIIPEADFYRLKHRGTGPSGKSRKGKSHPPRNPLTGLVFCKRCGGKMHYVNKGRGHVYLSCDNARRKKTCDAESVPYWPTFGGVMLHLDEFRSYDPNKKDDNKLQHEIDSLAGQMAEAQETIARLIDTLERVPSEAIEKRIAAWDSQLAALKARRKGLQEQQIVNKRNVASDEFDPVSEYIIVGDFPEFEIEPERMSEAVAHLSSEIKRLVERVIVEKGQPVEIVPRED